jgi:hypothetical protein
MKRALKAISICSLAVAVLFVAYSLASAQGVNKNMDKKAKSNADSAKRANGMDEFLDNMGFENAILKEENAKLKKQLGEKSKSDDKGCVTQGYRRFVHPGPLSKSDDKGCVTQGGVPYKRILNFLYNNDEGILMLRDISAGALTTLEGLMEGDGIAEVASEHSVHVTVLRGDLHFFDGDGNTGSVSGEVPVRVKKGRKEKERILSFGIDKEGKLVYAFCGDVKKRDEVYNLDDGSRAYRIDNNHWEDGVVDFESCFKGLI